MAERFDIGKLLRGFNIFNGAIFGKLVQQVIMIIIVLVIIVGIWYKVFYQRTNVQHQNAAAITNVTTENKDGFNLLKIKFLGFGN